jgi:hypothetical protein
MSSVHPNEPWHTEQWFTSPWNHDPEVAASFAFPERITVHDVTLRDGEQQAGWSSPPTTRCASPRPS